MSENVQLEGVSAVSPSQSRNAVSRNILLAAALALVCGVVVTTVDLPAARIPAGLILELVLPGYALSAFISQRSEMRGAELTILALGASLVVSTLGGLLLDELPGRTGRLEWALLLTIVTLLVLGAASHWPRERRKDNELPENERSIEAREWLGLRWLRKLETSARLILNCTLGAIVLGLGVGAVAIARRTVDRAPGFTELSAFPTASGGRSSLAITVASHERHVRTFYVTVRENGRLTSFSEIQLRPRQRWRLIAPLGPNTRRVQADVRRGGSAVIYLHTVYYTRAQHPERVQSSRRK